MVPDIDVVDVLVDTAVTDDAGSPGPRPKSARGRQRQRSVAFAFRDEILRLHNDLGLGDAEIATRLDIPLADVVREREDMGVADTSYAGIVWSREADQVIWEQRLRGRFWQAIAEMLPGFSTPPSGRAVSYRFEYLQRLHLRSSRNGHKKKRNCLGCGQEFPSEGNHNRLCQVCRDESGPDDAVAIGGGLRVRGGVLA